MKSLVKIIFTSGLLFGVIHNTFAQSSFDGAFSQIGVGYANVSPSISTTPISITPLGSFKASVNPSSQGSATGTISVGYYSSLSSNFLVGLGADYSPFSLSSGAVSGSATLPRGTLAGSGTYTVNNSYSLYLSPAYAVHKDGLIYATIKDCVSTDSLRC